MKYDRSFYEERHKNTLYSARTVLNKLKEVYSFESAVDFGCGTGTWLYVCKELGAKKVQGYDGPWVPTEYLNIEINEFQELDFNSKELDNSKHDLAISLEVAEHLSKDTAKYFVKNLCSSANVVLFSAAIPFQGGNGHINEQWLDYWIELFKVEGYEAADFIRPHIWNEKEIPFWYKQNLLVFYNPESTSIAEKIEKSPSFNSFNLVHPDMFLIRANPSTIERAKLLVSTPKYILNRLNK